ncbi:MAG: tetratricopeptide repeat protein [bacterium]|nr:tetratricopeptide repeat protein [bacterium]
MAKVKSREERAEELRELYSKADTRDSKKRNLIINIIVGGIVALAVIAYFVITAGPAESRTALRVAQGIQSFGLAFEGHQEYPEGENAQPVWVEPTPEETTQRLSEALAIFNEVAQNPGSDFDRDTAVLYVGMCALHLGNLDQAEEKLTQVAESEYDPLRQQARYTLGSVMLERGQLAEALKYYQGLGAEEDNYLATTAKLETARILGWLGRPDESKAVLDGIVKAGPEGSPDVQMAQWMLDQGIYLTHLVDLIPLKDVSIPRPTAPPEGLAVPGPTAPPEGVIPPQ